MQPQKTADGGGGAPGSVAHGAIAEGRNGSEVFVNRPVHMASIRAVGFDLDFTLLEYNWVLERLIFDKARAYLVEKLHYPISLFNAKYLQASIDPRPRVPDRWPDEEGESEGDETAGDDDDQYPQTGVPFVPPRGIFIDIHTGNLLKIDEFGNVAMGCHGARVLFPGEIEAVYPFSVISKRELESSRFKLFDTFFAAPQSCLWITMVDNVSRYHDVNYQSLWTDLRYVHNNRMELKNLMRGLKQGGNKTFVLTNSQYGYAISMLRFLFELHDYFDYIVVGAQKPHWFGEGIPLREVTNHVMEDIVPQDQVHIETQLSTKRVTYMHPRKVYQGGSIAEFTALTGLTPGSVLYCGDQLLGDISRPKGAFWRTCLIVPEIQWEVKAVQKNLLGVDCLVASELNQSRYLARHDINHIVDDIEEARMQDMQSQVDVSSQEIQVVFNDPFGSIFTTTSARTYYGSRVFNRSDLYTAKVTNLANYSPFNVFRPEMAARFMPHQHMWTTRAEIVAKDEALLRAAEERRRDANNMGPDDSEDYGSVDDVE
ncbi:HAD-superfamily hydrolase, subfamily IG, 5'-nucleotidase [Kipferlia bialata]|uniref:HAD-superfamily hydrolase, subfamily IG, 5'-nucleotidase n=1 Tax=Kipferlia bialata TaxID=797122 RepID=A0A9K3CQP5_9EUKA|nr:HAD-superfamily hydrolase, subfamily IG, 5'-nucleotidase [Kipferlia bialata]|eukprot:g2394.t1